MSEAMEPEEFGALRERAETAEFGALEAEAEVASWHLDRQAYSKPDRDIAHLRVKAALLRNLAIEAFHAYHAAVVTDRETRPQAGRGIRMIPEAALRAYVMLLRERAESHEKVGDRYKAAGVRGVADDLEERFLGGKVAR